MLEQNVTRKRQMNQSDVLLELKREFEAGDRREYKVVSITNSAVYGKEVENQLPGLYT